MRYGTDVVVRSQIKKDGAREQGFARAILFETQYPVFELKDMTEHGTLPSGVYLNKAKSNPTRAPCWLEQIVSRLQWSKSNTLVKQPRVVFPV